MNVWPLNKISNEEKSNILSQHRHVYNGYRSINPTVSNEQPLYVQDFAKDKEGMVINNKGVTKKYTNFAINESEDKELCTECGGQMYEGECMECGDKMYEGECTECGDEMYEDIYDVDDLTKENKFDYVENDDIDDSVLYEMGDDETVYELEIDEKYFEDEDNPGFEPMESAFSNEEGEVDEWAAPLIRAAATGAGAELAGRAADYVSSKFESEDLEEEIDDDLKESFKSEKSRIMEMMNRMKVLK